MSDSNDPWATPPADETPQPPPNPYGDQPPINPYGNQPPVGYGQPPAQPTYQPPYGLPQGYAGTPGYGYAPIAPKHPQATTALVLGIIGLVGTFICLLPILLAPIAWVIGGKAVKEIDSSPQSYSGRDQAQAGRIMGIIGTVLLILGVLAIALLIALGTSGAFDEVVYEPNV